jgi:hypothetical protein
LPLATFGFSCSHAPRDRGATVSAGDTRERPGPGSGRSKGNRCPSEAAQAGSAHSSVTGP